MKKEDKIVIFIKYIVLQFCHIACFIYMFLWSYVISLLLIYHTQNFMAKQVYSFLGIIRTFINFLIFDCVTFLSLLLFVFKAQYLLLIKGINLELSQ